MFAPSTSKTASNKGIKSEVWPVFICYRRSDGKEIADLLFDVLHNYEFSFFSDQKNEKEKCVKFDVYLDRAQGSDPDYVEKIDAYIKNAKAFIVVCSESSGGNDRGKMDVFRHEIEVWLKINRDKTERSAPILFSNAQQNFGSHIPDLIVERWPRLNVLPINVNKQKRGDGNVASSVDETVTRELVVKSLVDKTVDRYNREISRKNRWRWIISVTALIAALTIGLLAYLSIEKTRQNTVAKSAELARSAEVLQKNGKDLASFIAALDSWPSDDFDTERQDPFVRKRLSEELTTSRRLGTINIPNNTQMKTDYFSVPPSNRVTFSYLDQTKGFVEVSRKLTITESDGGEAIEIRSAKSSELHSVIDLAKIITQRFQALSDETKEAIAGNGDQRPGFYVIETHQNLSGTVIGLDVGYNDFTMFRILFKLSSRGEFELVPTKQKGQFEFIFGSELMANKFEDKIVLYDFRSSKIVQTISLKSVTGDNRNPCTPFSNDARSSLEMRDIGGLYLVQSEGADYITVHQIGKVIYTFKISTGEIVADVCPFDGQFGVVFNPVSKSFLGWGLFRPSGLRVSSGNLYRYHSNRNWKGLLGSQEDYSHVEVKADGLIYAWPTEPSVNPQLEIYDTDRKFGHFKEYPGGIEAFEKASLLGFRYEKRGQGYLVPLNIFDTTRSLLIVPKYTGYTITDFVTGINLMHILFPSGHGPLSTSTVDGILLHLTSEKLFAILRWKTEYAAVYFIDLGSLGSLELRNMLCERLDSYLDLRVNAPLEISASIGDSTLAECLQLRVGKNSNLDLTK